MSSPRLGWLFAHDWDREALDRLAAAGTARFDTAGFDLFAFPSNTGLVFFDHHRFARRQSARARRLGWRGVVSHQEHFGALAAALVAEATGLPGATPESILAAQHKLHARRVLQQVAPEANLAFAPLEAEYGDDIPGGIAYPAFVKPVKAAFSVLARTVSHRAELQAHTRFSARELWVIRHLVDPFERLCRERLPQAGSAHRMLLEEPVPLHVPQYNLDGWVADGSVHTLGVVDAVMYPGTRAFMRWDTPTRLAPAIQSRALDVARRFLAGVGYRHGFFNLEFFHDPATDRLTVIECNPRLASQFGDLYRRTLGADPHAMAVALACGDDPLAVPRTAPTASLASSLVYRAFDPADIPAMPDAAARAAFAREFDDALLFTLPKSGHALARDFKWTGNHRYGIVHLGARDRGDLDIRARRASALLGWPAPCLDAAPSTNPPTPRARWGDPFSPFTGPTTS
jgi:biotin carboxylase